MMNWLKRLFNVKAKNTGNLFAMTSGQSDTIAKRVAESFSKTSLTTETLLLIHVLQKVQHTKNT